MDAENLQAVVGEGMMDVDRCPPLRFENITVNKVASPFFKVYTDSKSADTTKVIGGGGFRNKPLEVIGGDDSSSANILRKYGSNLWHDDSDSSDG